MKDIAEIKDINIIDTIEEITPMLEETGRKIGGMLSDAIDSVVDAIFGNIKNSEV